MRTLLVLLALTAPAAAAPVCDPEAAPGDRGPLLGHYMCQITQNRTADDPFPCEVITGSNHTGYLRSAKLKTACMVTGTIDKGGFDGGLWCFATDTYLDAFVNFKTKLQSIPGGFAVEVKTDIVHTRVVDPNDTSIPRKTVDRTDPLALAVTVCRKPWPSGFKNEIEELEQHSKE